MAARKMWRVVTWTGGGSVDVLATGQRDAFNIAHRHLRAARAGQSRVHTVVIKVDERRGAGWQTFERLTVADVPETSS